MAELDKEIISRFLEDQRCIQMDAEGGFEVWRAPTKRPMYYFTNGKEIYGGAEFSRKRKLDVTRAELEHRLKW
jgi:hypothetical protein